jgi:class 3 adenylate cyclase
VLAELIPDSTLVEFEGEDHMFWLADNWKEVTDAHIRFMKDADVKAPVERSFAAVVFTDIVESTRTSLVSGDSEWRIKLDAHDRITRQVVHRHQGVVVKHTGDGILATFKMPSQAIEAIVEMRDELTASGIPIRAGIHAGEIEIRGEDVSGAVVNLAARVEQAADEGDIYVTKSLRDLLLGSAQRFERAGDHTLKGFDGVWELHRLVAD